ncbi:hypothetical protein G6011_11475 [Alternaria panax]|uniref:Uncharacterized protein n=1 Tax=Alternaria panax TaxID=48097 RepID=A0AAD4NPZ5_9PLEO|nr:hypothetical protein G6011_11475 [Alternaria panax]
MADQSPMSRWLRTILAAVTKKSPPDQQPEAEEGTDETQQEQSNDNSADGNPGDEPREDGEDNTSEHDMRDDEDAANTSPSYNAAPVRTNGFINAVRECIVDKVTLIVAQAKDAIASIIDRVKQLRVTGAAKAVTTWIKQHPWETTLVLVPLVATGCMAIVLLIAGFGPGGIIAGSTAAAIQAGIGNIVAGSIFATCTSAMMGGYGAVFVFGGAWLGSTALIVGLAAAWRRWNSQHQHAIVLLSGSSLQTAGDRFQQAASDATFLTICAAAYLVYRFKRCL